MLKLKSMSLTQGWNLPTFTGWNSTVASAVPAEMFLQRKSLIACPDESSLQ